MTTLLPERENAVSIRAACAAVVSPHGLAKRNVALVQLLLQTVLRVSEVAAVKHEDLQLGARAALGAHMRRQGVEIPPSAAKRHRPPGVA